MTQWHARRQMPFGDERQVEASADPGDDRLELRVSDGVGELTPEAEARQ